MFDQVIAPVGRANFLEEYFEKKPLLLRGSCSNLKDLFSLADFDRYLAAGEGILQDLVRIAHNGRAITIPASSGQSTTQREFVLEQFKAGATLKLEDLDSRNSEVSKLCKELEATFGGYAFAKPFLTGPNFPGLATHFDTTEVFVVQLEGRKVWNVWNKVVESPTLPMQQNLADIDLGPATIEVILEPGDMLYIPAGTPHSAKCLDEHSLHMAFGLQPVKMFEVLEGYLRLMSEHALELRKNIYPFSDLKTLDELAKSLIERMSRIPFATMWSDFDIAYNSTKHETCDMRLTTLAKLNKLNEDTKLRVRQGANLNVRKSEGTISIYFSSTISPGKPLISAPSNLTMPDYCAGEVEDICSKGNHEFSAEGLVGKLNVESKLVLCRRLAEAGVLVLS